jgi:hypothetical protein
MVVIMMVVINSSRRLVAVKSKHYSGRCWKLKWKLKAFWNTYPASLPSASPKPYLQVNRRKHSESETRANTSSGQLCVPKHSALNTKNIRFYAAVTYGTVTCVSWPVIVISITTYDSHMSIMTYDSHMSIMTYGTVTCVSWPMLQSHVYHDLWYSHMCIMTYGTVTCVSWPMLQSHVYHDLWYGHMCIMTCGTVTCIMTHDSHIYHDIW